MAQPGEFKQPLPGYDVLELLGSGGTSSVYKARQRSLQRLVALKVLRSDRFQNKTILERLRKEARVLATLDHPNIVRSIDFGQVGDLVYFAMEYVDGRSARQILDEKGKLSYREATLIAEKVAEALEHAAAHGVIHRDVKPGNILLGRDGSVHLTDFGLARAALDRSVTNEGNTVGTPQYMSPEQVRNARRVDVRSDLYSLGASLYHMSTGHAPFEGETLTEILHAVLYENPIVPEQWDRDYPRPLSQLIARLMAKNPARRYQDVSAALVDLRKVLRWLNGQPLDHESPVGLSWKESMEPAVPVALRVGMGVAAAALVVLGIVLAVSFFGSGDEVKRENRAELESRILVQLREELQNGVRRPLAAFQSVERLLNEGTLTEASALERSDVLQLARDQQLVRLQQMGDKAWHSVVPLLASADLEAARIALTQEIDRRLGEDLGVESDKSLAWMDLHKEQQALRSRLEERLNTMEQRLESDLQAYLQAEKDRGGELLNRRLSAREYDLIDEDLLEFDVRLDLALFEFVERVLKQNNISPALTDNAEVLRERLPAELRDWLSFQRESLLAGWEKGRDQDLYALQISVIHSITDQLALDLIRIQQGEVDREAQAWVEDLESRVLPGGLAFESFPKEPRDVTPTLDRYRQEMEVEIQEARKNALQHRLTRLFRGGEVEPGVDKLLTNRSLEEALTVLEKAASSAPIAVVAEQWRKSVQATNELLNQVKQRLAKQVGESVRLKDSHGIELKGTLETTEAHDVFRVGATRVSVKNLAIDETSLKEWGLLDSMDSDVRALVLYYFGRNNDRGVLDAFLERTALDPSPVLERIRELRSAERDAEVVNRVEGEELAFSCNQQLLAALEAGDGELAQELWDRLKTVHGRSRMFADLRPKRLEYERRIDLLKRRTEVLERLARAMPGAIERQLLEEDGGGFRCRVRYEFGDPETLQDFEGAQPRVQIKDGKLTFPTADDSQALQFGPRLPFPFDLKSSYTLRLDLETPYRESEQEHPHFVGIQVGAISAAFFRPREPRGDRYSPQLNVWEGPLDAWREYFSTPSYENTRPKKARSRETGLERATSYVVEIRYLGPPSRLVEVLVNKAGVEKFALTSDRTSEGTANCLELRSTSAIRIESMEIEGRVQ